MASFQVFFVKKKQYIYIYKTNLSVIYYVTKFRRKKSCFSSPSNRIAADEVLAPRLWSWQIPFESHFLLSVTAKVLRKPNNINKKAQYSPLLIISIFTGCIRMEQRQENT